MTTFREELTGILNRKCRENISNTPDFILADFLIDCINTFDNAVKRRDRWYSVHLEPGSVYFIPPDYNNLRTRLSGKLRTTSNNELLKKQCGEDDKND